MDRLAQIFEMQGALNENIRERRVLAFSREEWIQKHTLAMISELSELLDEVNFKWWKNPRPVNEDSLKEELVDVLHFFVSMCIDAGMDAEELHRHPLHPYTQALISAIPDIDVDAKRQRVLLEGDVPSPTNLPGGCPFHTRCPQCMARCREERPAFVERAPGHAVACHLHE